MTVKKRFMFHAAFVIMLHNVFAIGYVLYLMNWLQHIQGINGVELYAILAVSLLIMLIPWIGNLTAVAFIFKFLPDANGIYYVIATMPIVVILAYLLLAPEKIKFQGFRSI